MLPRWEFLYLYCYFSYLIAPPSLLSFFSFFNGARYSLSQFHHSCIHYPWISRISKLSWSSLTTVTAPCVHTRENWCIYNALSRNSYPLLYPYPQTVRVGEYHSTPTISEIINRQGAMSYGHLDCIWHSVRIVWLINFPCDKSICIFAFLHSFIRYFILLSQRYLLIC